MTVTAVPSFVITEKTALKRNIEAAVGDKYGQIIALEGHLFRVVSPDIDDTSLANWKSHSIIMPKDHRFRWAVPAVADVRKSNPKAASFLELRLQRFAEIKKLLKKCHRVILACDDDSEGEWMPWPILMDCGWTIETHADRVFRAHFNSEDRKTIAKAFEALQPAAATYPRGQAAKVRAEADMAYGYTLTRLITDVYHPAQQAGHRDVINQGRVKNGVVGILCQREHEIRMFQPTTYHVLIADTLDANGATLGFALSHNPTDTRITDPVTAQAMATAIDRQTVPVVVTRQNKAEAPPKFLNQTEITSIAGKAGMAIDHVMPTLQSLYSGHKAISYPRTDCDVLGEEYQSSIGPLIERLKIVRPDIPFPATPVIRKSHFNDAILAKHSHPAIIPNINADDPFEALVPKMTTDEKLLFDVIVAHTVAAVSDDYIYEGTVITANPLYQGQPIELRATGAIPRSAGWRAVLTLKPDEDEIDEDSEIKRLPPVDDGQLVTLHPIRLDARKTTPPKRIKLVKLPSEMKEAHRHVPDPHRRDVIKQAVGIGTAHTRNGIIQEMLDATIIATNNKKDAIPSDRTYQIWLTLRNANPDLYDPGASAIWEESFQKIGRRELDPMAFLDQVDGALRAHVAVIEANQPTPAPLRVAPLQRPVAEKRPPTPATATPGPAALPPGAIRLKVPMTDNRRVRSLGAKWSTECKTWYIPKGVDPKAFSAWK